MTEQQLNELLRRLNNARTQALDNFLAADAQPTDYTMGYWDGWRHAIELIQYHLSAPTSTS